MDGIIPINKSNSTTNLKKSFFIDEFNVISVDLITREIFKFNVSKTEINISKKFDGNIIDFDYH